MSSAGERTALLKYQCLKADKWSHYPATQDVNMGCNSIINLQSETFCDGTYIGPGGSFDISSGQAIDITSSSTLTMSGTNIDIDTPQLTLNNVPLATKPDILYYDSVTKAVSYGPAFPAITVQAATGTIALTAAMDRSTYILTGTSATQLFSQAGLVGVAAGWTVYLRNGNNATGLTQDITISIPAGNTTLHAPTGTTNSSFILLYWNGSALVAYR